MSLQKLARKVGMPISTLHHWLTRRVTLASWEEIAPIVAALDGDLDDWLRRWRAAQVCSRRHGPLAVEPQLRGPIVPAQLPADVETFTGRRDELSELDHLVIHANPSATALVISAVSGTAGVGKTALAVHWAHRVGSRFPDGHLYVDLRGYDPEQPVQPGEALDGFLRSLSVAEGDIPGTLAQRAAVYRSLLAGRRILILLDNAHAAEQVRGLLPGTPSCLVLVTSRESLAGLVARNGAHRIELDLLTRDEAIALLRSLIGERVDEEPEAASELADRCARLPLALRIGTEVVRDRVASSVHHHQPRCKE